MPGVEIPSKLLEAFHEATRVVALTGSGISAESGVPTFRDAQTGLWARYDPQQLATPEAFERDPRLVWEWYEWRRTLVAEAMPNPGHKALVELERRIPGFTLVTQNVDGLHLDAGSVAITEIHGNRHKLRCIACGRRGPSRDFTEDEVPPLCDRCGGVVKSDTVMFGEPIPRAFLETCFEEVGRTDLMLVIGTSATVYPAADFPMQVLRRGGAIIEVNVDETPFSPYAAVTLRGPSGELLPRVVDALRE